MSLPAEYFDGLYAAEADPWGFRNRWYERRKRALTLAALPRERYARAFEPGCSIGELTADLAPRCDELIAMDLSAAAVEAATRRTAAWPQVSSAVGSIPHDWPTGPLDLIVLSEVAYYLETADLERVAELACDSLAPSGTLIACHWRHPTNYPQTGDAAQAALATGLHRTGRWEDDDILLEVWSKDAQSVALTEGLL